jgi:hypothetical protein
VLLSPWGEAIMIFGDPRRSFWTMRSAWFREI